MLLVVTAVEAERDAAARELDVRPDRIGRLEVLRGDGVVLLAGGVGPAAAAAVTATALSAGPFDLVLSAGIGGGFAPVELGQLVVASMIVFADLGAETADGFAPLSQLGFGDERARPDPATVTALAAAAGARTGTVLTVATVTGSAETAQARHRAYPDALAEGMEGAGVAAAAILAGVPFGEIRAISNPVGPRDRAAWRIGPALDTLARAFDQLAGAGWTSS